MTAVDRMWRRVVIWSAAAVVLAGIAAVLSLSIASKVVSDAQDSVTLLRGENQQLRDSVAANDQRAECRSRIINAAEQLRAERDSLGWQSLVDRFVAGREGDLSERADRVAALNTKLLAAAELRSRSIDLCNENPGYQPPN